MSPRKRVPPIKDLAIISDPATIKVLMEPTRSQILFKYLVNGAMTVKQLADALGKNPGTILHHIREYRLGLSELRAADDGVAKFAESRLNSMIRALSVYGIKIDEDAMQEAADLLGAFLERENKISADISIVDEAAYHALPEPVRRDASRIYRRFVLEEDATYRELRERWHSFLRRHRGSDGKK